ncbi:unnamed protein product [Camellia sinensis]
MWEEEEEQILERLRNQPIQSPPPSPSSSVFLFCPQLYLSLPPPLTPQFHFSPPPTTSVLMSPYLDFSPPPPPPPPIFLSKKYLMLVYVQWNRRRACQKKKKGHGSLLKLKFVTKSVQTVEEPFSPPCSLLVALDSIIKTHHELAKKPDDFEEVIFDEVLEEEMLEKACVPEALPSLLEFTIPPKSPKMVSIGSWLSVVKISRKISIRLLQVLPSVQLPQTLHIVIVEEKMTHLLNCSGGFISQIEERSVEIMVEVDATNNGAHGVKAYENFPIVSHSEKKNTRDKLKRNYKSISVITREDLEQNFGSSREDVANSFGVSVSTMKRIFRKHGISRWPFQPDRKKGRSMEVISPSMHEKPDSRLRCIQTPLHARSSPRSIALLDEGEMVQLDSSKQQSLVEFDVTKNSAHLVRASQRCSTVSHSDETNSRETLKRECTTESVLSFEDLQQHFGCKLEDAAKALGVSVSTVKRTCRQHGIPRWPSRKEKKVYPQRSAHACNMGSLGGHLGRKKKLSKTHRILLEQQGEKDVSPTYRKMPTDGQTERANEMVGHLQDQNEGPNMSNTENGSNEESITTPSFQDYVPVSEMNCILLEPEREKTASPTCKTPTVGIVLDFIEGPNLSNTENHSNEESIITHTCPDFVLVFERDCILLEPQGEKNMSPTHKTPTNGQIDVGNGMVGHIQDQNGIVPEFIEGPNLSNTENRSNEKSLSTPNFQDSIPGNYPAIDFSILSTDRESGEAGGSKDSRNFSTSAMGFLMGEHVSESSWTMPLRSDLAPMQTMTTIRHIMPHLTEKQDIRTMTFKAQYRDKKIKFRLSLPSGIVELKKQVTNRLGELGSFEVYYEDNDNEWILIGCDTDVWDCFELSSSSGNEVVRLLVRD